jgi:hypothetical protein
MKDIQTKTIFGSDNQLLCPRCLADGEEFEAIHMQTVHSNLEDHDQSAALTFECENGHVWSLGFSFHGGTMSTRVTYQ